MDHMRQESYQNTYWETHKPITQKDTYHYKDKDKVNRLQMDCRGSDQTYMFKKCGTMTDRHGAQSKQHKQQ
eukprot:2376460-Heterocapsa_arctica.AAC.1